MNARIAIGHSQCRHLGGGGGAVRTGLSPGGGGFGCLLMSNCYASGPVSRNWSAPSAIPGRGAPARHVRICECLAGLYDVPEEQSRHDAGRDADVYAAEERASMAI